MQNSLVVLQLETSSLQSSKDINLLYEDIWKHLLGRKTYPSWSSWRGVRRCYKKVNKSETLFLLLSELVLVYPSGSQLLLKHNDFVERGASVSIADFVRPWVMSIRPWRSGRTWPMIDEAMPSIFRHIFSDNVAKYFINIDLKNLADGFFKPAGRSACEQVSECAALDAYCYFL